MSVPQNSISGGNGGPITDAFTFADNTTTVAGNAIQISVSTGGPVTLTLSSGRTIVVNPSTAGGTQDNIYPYAVTKAVASGGTVVTAYYNLVR